MTAKTRAAITSEITTDFADNTSGAITPALLRQVTQDINDSALNPLSDGADYVASVNSIAGSVVLAAGSNVTISESGETITISASGGSSGVSSLNNETGAITLAGAGNVSISTSGETITITGSAQGATAFNALTSGTNTQAAMVIGTGASIAPTGSGVVNANEINSTSLSGLSTGILKNTTGTGVPSIAVAGDFPTLNQNTTGTASNITATSNSTLTTLNDLSLPYSQLSGSVPTWNQNTTGNAATVTTINGRMSAGSNVTITGSGTSGSPYVIGATSGSSPGGSSGQVQYNNSGSFAGTAGATVNGSGNLTFTGAGSSTLADDSTQPAIFTGGSTSTAGNLYGIAVIKTGYEEALFGINKNTATGAVHANGMYLSTYTTTGTWSIGRGNGAGLPNTADISGSSTGLVTIPNSVIGGINLQTSSYTIALTDTGSTVQMSSGSAMTFTVPPNASVAFPIGSVVNLIQYGAGLVTITAGAGVTIDSLLGLITAGQYSVASVQKIGTDEWVAYGALT